jgi:hypothetical protein
VSYVEAGYSIGLGVLFLYAVGLVIRRRSLERAVDPSPPTPVPAERASGSAPASGP